MGYAVKLPYKLEINPNGEDVLSIFGGKGSGKAMRGNKD